jgi:N-carbamoyl-L-amino-acid hydrolase
MMIAMTNQPNAVGAIGHIDVHQPVHIIPEKWFLPSIQTHLLDKLNAMRRTNGAGAENLR